MKALKEIATVSGFVPKNGKQLQLYRLVMEGADRRSAKTKLLISDRDFNKIYHQLKEYLVWEVLNNSLKKLSRYQRLSCLVRRNYETAMMLLLMEKRLSGIPLARSTMRKAESLGLYQVALDLSRKLCMHYSYMSPNPDTKKYKYYCDKQEEYEREVKWEMVMERLFFDYSHHHVMGGALQGVEERLAALADVEVVSPRFHFLRFNCLALHQQIMRDESGMLATCKAALHFFKDHKDLPYIIRFSFQYRLVAVHLAHGDFAQAEVVLNHSLQYPKVGGKNWQILMLHRALLGFHSGKTAIVLDAYRQSLKIPGKLRTDQVQERWRIVRAYLELFDVELGSWRLSRFMNSFTFTLSDKTGPYLSVLIVEMVHLARQGRMEAYSYRCERMKAYITRYLKKREDLERFVHFFRLLQCVVRGGYIRAEVEKKAKPYLKKLKSSSPCIGADVREVEVVPFERLWGMVLDCLK